VGRNIFKVYRALAHGEESQLRAKAIPTGNRCSVNLDWGNCEL